MNQRINKGTKVRIRTTNGGDAVVTLLEDYRPTYTVCVEPSCGRGYYFVSPDRLKSIEVVVETLAVAA
jgi:hypothetical protein